MHILFFPNTSKSVYLSLKLCVKQFLSLHNTLRFKSSLQLWTLFNLFSRAHILSLTDCVLLTGGTLAWRCGLGQKQCSYKLAKQTAHKGLLPQCSRWWPSCRRTDVAAGHPCPIMHYLSYSNLKTNIIYFTFQHLMNVYHQNETDSLVMSFYGGSIPECGFGSDEA